MQTLKVKLNVYVQQTNLKVSEIERQLGKTKKEFDNAAEAHEKAFNNCVQGSRFTSVRRRQNTLQEKEVLLKLWEAKLEEAVCISESHDPKVTMRFILRLKNITKIWLSSIQRSYHKL